MFTYVTYVLYNIHTSMTFVKYDLQQINIKYFKTIQLDIIYFKKVPLPLCETYLSLNDKNIADYCVRRCKTQLNQRPIPLSLCMHCITYLNLFLFDYVHLLSIHVDMFETILYMQVYSQ